MASDTANALSNVKYSSDFLDVFNYDEIHFNSLTQYNYNLRSQASRYAFTDN